MAVLFEAYCAACFDLVADNGNLHCSRRTIPGLEFSSAGPARTSIGSRRLAILRSKVGRALTDFQNKIHGSQGVIDAVYEFQGGDDLFDAIILHGCEHGLEAWAIASEMRSKYNLGQAETIFDYADFLKTRRDSVRESIDEKSTAQAEMLAELSRDVRE